MQVNGVYVFGIVNILEGIKYYNANEEMGKQDNKAAASNNRKNNSSSIHWD